MVFLHCFGLMLVLNQAVVLAVFCCFRRVRPHAMHHILCHAMPCVERWVEVDRGKLRYYDRSGSDDDKEENGNGPPPRHRHLYLRHYRHDHRPGRKLKDVYHLEWCTVTQLVGPARADHDHDHDHDNEHEHEQEHRHGNGNGRGHKHGHDQEHDGYGHGHGHGHDVARPYCFKVEVSPSAPTHAIRPPLVLQAADDVERTIWVATLAKAIAVARGGGQFLQDLVCGLQAECVQAHFRAREAEEQQEQQQQQQQQQAEKRGGSRNHDCHHQLQLVRVAKSKEMQLTRLLRHSAGCDSASMKWLTFASSELGGNMGSMGVS